MRSGSEEGSYLRRIDFESFYSRLESNIKKKEKITLSYIASK